MSDSTLIQIVSAALEDVTRRSGAHLACHPGCSQCCHGVFPISQLDVERLRAGLKSAEPDVAARIRARVADAVARLTPDFPGDAATGILNPEDSDFDDFANDEPCPVLDPATQTCDLYSARPMTCRTFGPPVRSYNSNYESAEDAGFAICELCFTNATAEEIAACEMVPDPENLEPALIAAAEERTGLEGETIVAFALRNR